MRRLIEEHPDIKNQIETLLQQISISLPINSLYIDLTSDEKMDNDSEMKSQEIIELFRNTIEAYAGDNKEDFIKLLLTTEPFCNYQEDVLASIKKGEIV